jgi:hypothetical protein
MPQTKAPNSEMQSMLCSCKHGCASRTKNNAICVPAYTAERAIIWQCLNTEPRMWSRVPLVPAALRLQMFARNQVNANVRVLHTDNNTPIQWFPKCEPGSPGGGRARLFEGHENSRSFAASTALLASVSFIRCIIIIIIIIMAATWIYLQICDIIKGFQTLCILSLIGA